MPKEARASTCYLLATCYRQPIKGALEDTIKKRKQKPFASISRAAFLGNKSGGATKNKQTTKQLKDNCTMLPCKWIEQFLLILLSSLFVLLFRRFKIAMIPLLLSHWVMVCVRKLQIWCVVDNFWTVWFDCKPCVCLKIEGGHFLKESRGIQATTSHTTTSFVVAVLRGSNKNHGAVIIRLACLQVRHFACNPPQSPQCEYLIVWQYTLQFQCNDMYQSCLCSFFFCKSFCFLKIRHALLLCRAWSRRLFRGFFLALAVVVGLSVLSSLKQKKPRALSKAVASVVNRSVLNFGLTGRLAPASRAPQALKGTKKNLGMDFWG